MKILKYLFLVCVLSFILVSCIQDKADDIEKVKKNDVLPDFEVTLNTGEKINTKSLSGRVSVIVFFNSHCSDCRELLPSVQRLYDAYSDEVTFLLISRGQSLDEVLEYWKEKKYTMPFVPSDDRKIYNLFATSRIPRIYISNMGTRVVKIYRDNPVPKYNQLRNVISSLLKK